MRTVFQFCGLFGFVRGSRFALLPWPPSRPRNPVFCLRTISIYITVFFLETGANVQVKTSYNETEWVSSMKNARSFSGIYVLFTTRIHFTVYDISRRQYRKLWRCLSNSKVEKIYDKILPGLGQHKTDRRKLSTSLSPSLFKEIVNVYHVGVGWSRDLCHLKEHDCV